MSKDLVCGALICFIVIVEVKTGVSIIHLKDYEEFINTEY